MRVYKFLPAKDALKDLAEHRIKISEFSDMNDPFELKGARLYSNKPYLPASAVAEIEKAMVDGFKGSYGALCFSRGWSNPLLWSHYADKHKGICLGFELAPGEYVREPTYVDSQEQVCFDPIVDEPAGRARADEAMTAREPFMRLLSTKFKAWSYEDEVRLFVPMDRKDGDFFFYPFDEKLKLCKVIVGVRCSEPRTRIDEELKAYSDPIKIINTRLAHATFEVVEDTPYM